MYLFIARRCFEHWFQAFKRKQIQVLFKEIQGLFKGLKRLLVSLSEKNVGIQKTHPPRYGDSFGHVSVSVSESAV